MEFILFGCIGLLAFANGTNDIAKGIATLVGSGTMRPQLAILWAVAMTAAGALAGVSIAGGLLKTFSQGMLGQPAPPLLLAMATTVGATAWILFASKTGLPVSTTHAITGGLVGAGLFANGLHSLAWNFLAHKIFLPLALSPAVACTATWLVFPGVRRVLTRANDYCMCIELKQMQSMPVLARWESPAGTATTVLGPTTAPGLVIVNDKKEVCAQTIGSPVQLNAVDILHMATSGLTSFARGLNDTPKIAALLVGASLLGTMSLTGLFAVVAAGMCAGGLWGGRKVLSTMATKITSIGTLDGFAANLTSAALVTTATFMGLPLSTTHVTASAIAGIGMRSRGSLHWPTLRDIILAWLVTLPVAALLAYLAGALLLNFGR